MKIEDLSPRQRGRLERLVAAKAIEQVLIKYNFGNMAIPLMPDDPEQFSVDTGRVSVFARDGRRIGDVFDLPDQNAVAVVIDEPLDFVRDLRVGDYYPEDMGLDPSDPAIDELWPVAEIRDSLIEYASIDAPPILKRIINRPPRVMGLDK